MIVTLLAVALVLAIVSVLYLARLFRACQSQLDDVEHRLFDMTVSCHELGLDKTFALAHDAELGLNLHNLAQRYGQLESVAFDHVVCIHRQATTISDMSKTIELLLNQVDDGNVRYALTALGGEVVKEDPHV